MTLPYLRNILFSLQFFLVLIHSSDVDVSGQTITTRFWDCCKPSCSWKGKADFTQPVQTCNKDESPLASFDAGTACNGGSAYLCANQQAWAVNDTFSYGFAGIYIMGHVEDYWCCSCYQLDFTSDPLKNKSMIVQASNTAYDITTANRFSLAIPGGNTTTHDACAAQYGVNETTFGAINQGVASIDDCDNLPTDLQAGCRWRFSWFLNADYPNANFKRVACPAALTNITGCLRDDDKDVTAQPGTTNNGTKSSAASLSPASSVVGSIAVAVVGLLSL